MTGHVAILPAVPAFVLGAIIGWLLNGAVFGRLALVGQNLDRGTGGVVRYPSVALGTGVVFAAVTARLAQLHLLSAAPAFLSFTAVGIALALIDLDCRRLPNTIVLPSYPVLATALTGSAWWRHDWWALARAGIGAAALLAFFGAVVLIHPAGMGLGDVKLSGIIGLVLGYLSWSALVIAVFLGFLLGAVAGVALIASGRANRKSAVPFGPFMVSGALLALFLAGPVAHLHLLPFATGSVQNVNEPLGHRGDGGAGHYRREATPSMRLRWRPGRDPTSRWANSLHG